MPSLTNKYIFFILLVSSFPLFFLNIQNLHSMGGDDFAQYIKEAQNISHGQPYYVSNYVFNSYNNSYSPPDYPPGFPVLLAPVVKIWGIDYKAFCYFNTIIAIGLLFSFYVFFKKYMGEITACCLALLITYSGIMIDLKQTVLSDGTSLLFVMLYLNVRNAMYINRWRILLLILFAAAAILIRTQAILLLLAEVFYLFKEVVFGFIKKKKDAVKAIYRSPSLFIVTGCLLVIFLLNKLVFGSSGSASGFYLSFLASVFQKGLLTIIRDNINYLVFTVSSFFHYDTDNGIRTAFVSLAESAGLVFCCLGFIISITRKISFNDIFFVLMCGMMLYYPIHDTRYFLPAIAIVYYYCYLSLSATVRVVTKLKPVNVGLGLTIFYLVVGLRYLKSTTIPSAAGIPKQADIQAFNYLKDHVKDDEIILCARPRLTTLYTNKKCVIHAWQLPMETNKRVFDSMKVKYVLLNGIVDDYYHAYLNRFQHPVDSMNIAPGYVLYTLR